MYEAATLRFANRSFAWQASGPVFFLGGPS